MNEENELEQIRLRKSSYAGYTEKDKHIANSQ